MKRRNEQKGLNEKETPFTKQNTRILVDKRRELFRQPGDDFQSRSTSHLSKHSGSKRTANALSSLQKTDRLSGSCSDVRDSSIKRSISITLPNQLNDKLRKRIHTTNCVGGEGRKSEPEFRIRYSQSSKNRHQEVESRENRSRKSSEQASLAVARESCRKDRKKHYSSYHYSEYQAELPELVQHFTEVEKRNRARREKHRSYIELPGISDLAKRHEELHFNRLLRIKQDSDCHEPEDRGERRRRRSGSAAQRSVRTAAGMSRATSRRRCLIFSYFVGFFSLLRMITWFME